MSCYKPLNAYFSKVKNQNGKRDITFKPNEAYLDMPVQIACGRCIGCRLEVSRQWAVRAIHESQSHERNSFLTLTYSEENLPENGSLKKEHVQKFIKRLRKKFPKKNIRYLYCGEYGENLKRPHYHLCLFGVDFHQDRKLYKRNFDDHKLYNSEILNKLWPYGHAVIGDLTYQSAAYVARYVTKKVKGSLQAEKYGEKCDLQTGEVSLLLQPEFAEASRRPALGRDWFFENYRQVYPNDFVVVNKRPQKPPKYYDFLLEQHDPDLYTKVKYKRKKSMEKAIDQRPEDFDPYRLATKEEIRSRKGKRLTRSFENETICN